MPIDIYALQVCADSVSLTLNDLASSEYAKVLSLEVPCLVARVIRKKGDAAESRVDWSRIAYLRTGIFLDRHSAPAEWKQARLKQQRFVRSQDQPSRRCGPLYGQDVPAGKQEWISDSQSHNSHRSFQSPFTTEYCIVRHPSIPLSTPLVRSDASKISPEGLITVFLCHSIRSWLRI